MTTELKEEELNEVVGGRKFKDDGHRFNVHCEKRVGTVINKRDFQGVKGSEAKNTIVTDFTGRGFTCKVTNA